MPVERAIIQEILTDALGKRLPAVLGGRELLRYERQPIADGIIDDLMAAGLLVQEKPGRRMIKPLVTAQPQTADEIVELIAVAIDRTLAARTWHPRSAARAVLAAFRAARLGIVRHAEPAPRPELPAPRLVHDRERDAEVLKL